MSHSHPSTNIQPVQMPSASISGELIKSKLPRIMDAGDISGALALKIKALEAENSSLKQSLLNKENEMDDVRMELDSQKQRSEWLKNELASKRQEVIAMQSRQQSLGCEVICSSCEAIGKERDESKSKLETSEARFRDLEGELMRMKQHFVNNEISIDMNSKVHRSVGCDHSQDVDGDAKAKKAQHDDFLLEEGEIVDLSNSPRNDCFDEESTVSDSLNHYTSTVHERLRINDTFPSDKADAASYGPAATVGGDKHFDRLLQNGGASHGPTDDADATFGSVTGRLLQEDRNKIGVDNLEHLLQQIEFPVLHMHQSEVSYFADIYLPVKKHQHIGDHTHAIFFGEKSFILEEIAREVDFTIDLCLSTPHKIALSNLKLDYLHFCSCALFMCDLVNYLRVATHEWKVIENNIAKRLQKFLERRFRASEVRNNVYTVVIPIRVSDRMIGLKRDFFASQATISLIESSLSCKIEIFDKYLTVWHSCFSGLHTSSICISKMLYSLRQAECSDEFEAVVRTILKSPSTDCNSRIINLTSYGKCYEATWTVEVFTAKSYIPLLKVLKPTYQFLAEIYFPKHSEIADRIRARLFTKNRSLLNGIESLFDCTISVKPKIGDKVSISNPKNISFCEFCSAALLLCDVVTCLSLSCEIGEVLDRLRLPQANENEVFALKVDEYYSVLSFLGNKIISAEYTKDIITLGDNYGSVKYLEKILKCDIRVCKNYVLISQFHLDLLCSGTAALAHGMSVINSAPINAGKEEILSLWQHEVSSFIRRFDDDTKVISTSRLHYDETSGIASVMKYLSAPIVMINQDGKSADIYLPGDSEKLIFLNRQINGFQAIVQSKLQCSMEIKSQKLIIWCTRKTNNIASFAFLVADLINLVLTYPALSLDRLKYRVDTRLNSKYKSLESVIITQCKYHAVVSLPADDAAIRVTRGRLIGKGGSKIRALQAGLHCSLGIQNDHIVLSNGNLYHLSAAVEGLIRIVDLFLTCSDETVEETINLNLPSYRVKFSEERIREYDFRRLFSGDSSVIENPNKRFVTGYNNEDQSSGHSPLPSVSNKRLCMNKPPVIL